MNHFELKNNKNKKKPENHILTNIFIVNANIKPEIVVIGKSKKIENVQLIRIKFKECLNKKIPYISNKFF